MSKLELTSEKLHSQLRHHSPMETGSRPMFPEPMVFVVDDDPAIRKSLRWLIESINIKVMAFNSGGEFLESYDPCMPGCVVLDVRMPGMNGLDLLDKLRERGIEIPAIMMTAFGDVPMAVRAMKAGAVDFFEKPVSDQVLLDQIQRAIAKDLENRAGRADHLRIAQRKERLTKRETEVMRLVVDGLSSKQIAGELGISFKTIEAHRAKIMRKMEARSVPELIRMILGSA